MSDSSDKAAESRPMATFSFTNIHYATCKEALSKHLETGQSRDIHQPTMELQMPGLCEAVTLSSSGQRLGAWSKQMPQAEEQTNFAAGDLQLVSNLVRSSSPHVVKDTGLGIREEQVRYFIGSSQSYCLEAIMQIRRLCNERSRGWREVFFWRALHPMATAISGS